MYINGTEVGDSSIYLGTTGMESTGTRLLTNPVENLTGAVTVVLKFFDHVAGGNIQGKVLLDDFVLNGYVNDEAAGTGSGYQYAQNGYYRYGFNGKENDNEVKGEGNQQDYGMRVYDSRLGRFLSVDPLGTKTPYISPYVFVSNRPIWSVDYDGRLDFIINYVTVDEKGKEIKRISQTIKIQTFEDIKGIDRTPVIINVYDKIVFVEISPGVRTSTVKRNVVIDKNSGETTAPLGEYYQRTAPFYVASNKFMLNVTGLFGGKQFGAVMDGRDPETGEFLTQKRKIGEVVDGVVSLLTLGRAAATGKVKSLIGELVVDMIVDKISGTLSEEVFKEKFGWTSEESVKFLWGIGKLIYDGRKGDVNKVIEYMLSAIKLGASAPKVADELNKNFGIDVKAPLDKKAATETVLKTIDK